MWIAVTDVPPNAIPGESGLGNWPTKVSSRTDASQLRHGHSTETCESMDNIIAEAINEFFADRKAEGLVVAQDPAWGYSRPMQSALDRFHQLEDTLRKQPKDGHRYKFKWER
jgi:hypothetical protein